MKININQSYVHILFISDKCVRETENYHTKTIRNRRIKKKKKHFEFYQQLK